MQVLALAHSLVPCVDEKSGQLTYRTPSPDELALHDWVLTNGFRFLRRDSDVLTFAQGGAFVLRAQHPLSSLSPQTPRCR